MSCKVEKIGTNKAKFTIEVDNSEFLKAEDKAFNKEKGKLSAPGFRKGKVTKEMAFKVYGRNAFLKKQSMSASMIHIMMRLKEWRESFNSA